MSADNPLIRMLKMLFFIGVTAGLWVNLSDTFVSTWWHLGVMSVGIGSILSLTVFWFLGVILPNWVRVIIYGSGEKIPTKVQDHIIEQCADHYSALSRNVSKSLKINDYGAVVSDLRSEAVLDFLGSIKVNPDADKKNMYVGFVLTVLSQMELELSKLGFSPDSAPENGHEFEHWVARELTRFGWKARATAGAGDQGIDVIAEKHGLRVGIQCKRYASAVGNKSVQEALSGRKYHGLDVAAVLTTSSFTRAARQLAQSADIVLMTHYDLPEADRFLLTRQKTL